MRSTILVLLAVGVVHAGPAHARDGAGAPLVIPERTLLVGAGPVPSIRIGPLASVDAKGRKFLGGAVAVLPDGTEVALDASLRFSSSLLKCSWKLSSRKGSFPAVSCRIRAAMQRGSFVEPRGAWRNIRRPDLAAADLTGDGVAELLFSETREDHVRIVDGNLSLIAELWTGMEPEDLLVHDLNADGRGDVVVCEVTGDSAGVFLNTTEPWGGDGPPTFAPGVSFSAASTPRAVEAADFDRDGRPDLAFATHDIYIGDSTKLTVLRNLTEPGAETPAFGAPLLLDVLGRTDGFAVGDIDGDGWPDLVMPEGAGGEPFLGFFLNAGIDVPGPAFRTRIDLPVQDAPNGYSRPQAADLNSDGTVDLFLLRYFWPDPVTAVNLSTPADPEPVLLPIEIPGAGTAADAAVADLNGDGRPDLVLLDFGEVAFKVLLNRTAPGALRPVFRTIEVPYGQELEFQLHDVAVGDVTGDGWPDIVTSTAGGSVDWDSIRRHASIWRHSGFRLKFRPEGGKRQKVSAKEATPVFR